VKKKGGRAVGTGRMGIGEQEGQSRDLASTKQMSATTKERKKAPPVKCKKKEKGERRGWR